MIKFEDFTIKTWKEMVADSASRCSEAYFKQSPFWLEPEDAEIQSVPIWEDDVEELKNNPSIWGEMINRG